MFRSGYRIAAAWIAAIGGWQVLATDQALAANCFLAPCAGARSNGVKSHNNASPAAAEFPTETLTYSGEMRMMLGVVRCFKAPCPAPDYEIRSQDRTFFAKVHTIVVRTTSTGQIKSFEGSYFAPSLGNFRSSVLVDGDLWTLDKTAFVSIGEGIRETPRQ